MGYSDVVLENMDMGCITDGTGIMGPSVTEGIMAIMEAHMASEDLIVTEAHMARMDPTADMDPMARMVAMAHEDVLVTTATITWRNAAPTGSLT